MDTQEPMPEQVLLEQTISAGPLSLRITSGAQGGMVRVKVNGARLAEQEIKANDAVTLDLESPSGWLRVLADAGVEGLMASLL